MFKFLNPQSWARTTVQCLWEGRKLTLEINRCINASCQDYVWKTSRWGGVYDNYNHQSHRQFLNNNHSFNHHHLWITRYINLLLSTLIIIIFFIIWYTFTNNILWKETELPLTHTNEPMPYKNLDNHNFQTLTIFLACFVEAFLQSELSMSVP